MARSRGQERWLRGCRVLTGDVSGGPLSARCRANARALEGPEPPGLVVYSTPVVRPANRVFSPAELEARLRAHRRRIVANCPAAQRDWIHYRMEAEGQ